MSSAGRLLSTHHKHQPGSDSNTEYTTNSAQEDAPCAAHTLAQTHSNTHIHCHSTNHQRARCGYVWTKKYELYFDISRYGELCVLRLFAVFVAAAAAAAECLATKWVATPTACLSACAAIARRLVGGNGSWTPTLVKTFSLVNIKTV